jgi:DNA-binding transcriptional ArsR family regulator
VLANRRRLRILHFVMRRQEVHVTDVARALNIPVPTASQYLRALNARGLLRARRRGREVSYRVGDDPSLPGTRVLLRGLRPELEKPRPSLDVVFGALTAFTHPSRIAIVRAVARGASRVAEVCAMAGIRRRSAERHLKKLARRGYLRRVRGGYRMARPALPLAQSLLILALSGG